MKLKLACIIFSLFLQGCSTPLVETEDNEIVAQAFELSDVEGMNSVLEIFETQDLTINANGEPLAQVIVRPRIDTNQSNTLGQENASHEATDNLMSAASTLGIAAYEVGLTEYVTFEATRAQLSDLAQQGLFDLVVLDEPVPINMSSASQNIELPTLHAEGAEGLGKAIVIFDTGVDWQHPDFQSRVKDGACFSKNNSRSRSLCPNGGEFQAGIDAGQNCETSQILACRHGTHVAAIAAGSRALLNASGAAPKSDIISVQVFSRFDNAADCNGAPPCVLTWASDQLAALSYVRKTLSPKYPIAAINMSLGGGQQTTCPSDIRAGEIRALRAQGIATVISSGNSRFANHVGAPGCIPEAITVGAVNDFGSIAYFSNSGEAVDLLAPGVSITAAVPNNGHTPLQGTSMAAPVVAGLIASLQSYYTVSVDAVENHLKTTGVMRPMLNATRQRPWVRAYQAWQALDTSRPNGEFVYLRDQWADIGIEPNPNGGTYSASPDIWFRHQRDCPVNAHSSKDPIYGQLNYGCAYVRNVGNAKADGTLQLFFARANFDHQASWTLISERQTTLPPNTSAIVDFSWATVPAPGHYCSIARWVPDGEDTSLSFPGGFHASVRNSNDLVWKNFNSVSRKSGTYASDLYFETTENRTVNVVVQISTLDPGMRNRIGELILRLGGDPSDLYAEPTSQYYETDGRWVSIPLEPGVYYFPDIEIPKGSEGKFSLEMRFPDDDSGENDEQGPGDGFSANDIMRVSIATIEDTAEHKRTGQGELSSMNYVISD